MMGYTLNPVSQKRWVWMAEGWLRNPALTDTIIENDQKIKQLESQLTDQLSRSAIKDFMLSRALVNELYASYKIEHENLDRSKLNAAIIQKFELDIPPFVRDFTVQDNAVTAISWEQRIVDATQVLLAMPIDKVSPKAICTLHNSVKKENDGKTWGQFRKVAVGVYDGCGTPAYIAPSPIMVQPLMEQFCQWWNNERNEIPISVASALAHLFFVIIHPFEDGNGRMTRFLAMKALYGSEVKPYAVSPNILDNLWTYYDLLQTADVGKGGDDFLPFIEFIQSAQIKGLQWSLQHIKHMQCW